MAIIERTDSKGMTYRLLDFRDQDGDRVRESVGFVSKVRARELLRKRLVEVAENVYINPRKEDDRLGPTFTDFADRFMREYGSLRRSVYYRDALRLEGPIMSYFGKRRIMEITQKDLDWFRAHRSRQVGPSTVRKNLTVLGTMFRQAARWKVIPVNPAADLGKPSEPRHKVRFLAKAEWSALHEAAPTWLQSILTLAVVTGMRLGEIAGLRWEDVNRTADLLQIGEDTKTGTRALPINRTMAAVLDAQPEGSVFVFAGEDGKAVTTRTARNRISKQTVLAMKRAKIADATFHTLRHTAASWMVQAGRPLAEVKEILGHATMQTTLR